MANLELLNEKVNAMLEGEQKRREVAIDFLDKLEEILNSVALDVWGDGSDLDPYGEETRAVFVKNKNKEGANFETPVYYRYEQEGDGDQSEWTGFYLDRIGLPTSGRYLPNVKGREFWEGIRCLIDWLPLLVETLDNRNASRDRLLSLINMP